MFGKSLFDLISEKRKQAFADSVGPGAEDVNDTDPIASGDETDEHGFRLQLRRKRKAALLKRMLMQGGYGDMAKNVSVREF